jgi:hypothetical protein
VQAVNRDLSEHFNKQVQDIQSKVEVSNKQLFQNQQMMNNGLASAEEHIGLIRRVLNDALCGITMVTTISRPAANPAAAVGVLEETQVVDWNYYVSQFRAIKAVVAFFQGIKEVLRRAEAKERTEMVAKFLREQDIQTLTMSITEEERMKALVMPIIKGVQWTPQLFQVLRQLASKELQEKKPKEPPITPLKTVPKGNDTEAVAAAQQELLDEFKAVSEAAGQAVKAIEAGDEVGAAEAVAELERAADKQLEENPREAIQDFPDGAQIFGGK